MVNSLKKSKITLNQVRLLRHEVYHNSKSSKQEQERTS